MKMESKTFSKENKKLKMIRNDEDLFDIEINNDPVGFWMRLASENITLFNFFLF